MKHSFLTLLGFLLLSYFPVRAEEGMWLLYPFEPVLREKLIKSGWTFPADSIFNPESGLSDAVVSMDGGACTGSIISSQGLLLTNHHCAYADITGFSTVADNLLESGFWASSLEEEKPVSGKSVRFLREIRDVTAEVSSARDSLVASGFKGSVWMRLSRIFEHRYPHEAGFEPELTTMWRGDRYYLYYYQEYRDVRLVGFPPVSAAAFGGEAANWNWPQYKADFAFYRIYTAPDGSPASYAPENIPLKPRRFLSPASTGVVAGDPTVILGYPARTRRYTSAESQYERETILNPVAYTERRGKLDIWKRNMEADPEIRLKYADRYFAISNTADQLRWETDCMREYRVVERRRKEEEQLRLWILADSARRERYGDLAEGLRLAYTNRSSWMFHKTMYREAFARSCELLNNGRRFRSLAAQCRRRGIETLQPGDSLLTDFLYQTKVQFFERIDLETDKEVFAFLLDHFLKTVPATYHGEAFRKVVDACQGDARRVADYLFDHSLLGSPERMEAFFMQPRTLAEFENDLSIAVANSMRVMPYNDEELRLEERLPVPLDELETRYARALVNMRREKGEAVYPDANTTMRLTYGTVIGEEPTGTHASDRSQKASPFTTLRELLDRMDPSNPDYRLHAGFHSRLETRLRETKSRIGSLPVNFLTNHDITGGNSGSPVLNAQGDLVGIAFDGTRPGMAGDLWYHPELTRSVCVDIRFILWILEHQVPTSRLFDEISLSRRNVTETSYE